MSDNETQPFDSRFEQFAIQCMGTKWAAYIVRGFWFESAPRFSQGVRFLNIPPKVLSHAIKMYMGYGLLNRTVLSVQPSRVEYRLTAEGYSMIPVLDGVYQWGRKRMLVEGKQLEPLVEFFHGYGEASLPREVPVFKTQDPYQYTFSLIDGKWRIPVIRYLEANNTASFSNIMKVLAVNQKTLSLQLKALAEADVVWRRILPTMPVQSQYGLTEKGRSLLEILGQLRGWGETQLERLEQ